MPVSTEDPLGSTLPALESHHPRQTDPYGNEARRRAWIPPSADGVATCVTYKPVSTEDRLGSTS